MTPKFLRCVPVILHNEGGYQCDPTDPGNWTSGHIKEGELRGTNYGISAAQYPKEDIQGLTPQRAAEIYFNDYWQPHQCEEMLLSVALMYFDACVLSGPEHATRWLQTALGVPVDGKLGSNTMTALAHVTNTEGLIREMAEAREDFLRSLPAAKRFGTGWIGRVEYTLAAALTAVHTGKDME